MTPPALLPADPAHAPVLASIHATAFPAGECWTEPMLEEQLKLPGAFGWIDPEGGMVLARTVADEAEILTLAVAPARRGRGVGRALLAAAMRSAAGAGAIGMFLEVSVTNTAARRLYADAGFSEVGRRRKYYCDGTDAIILRAALLSESTVG